MSAVQARVLGIILSLAGSMTCRAAEPVLIAANNLLPPFSEVKEGKSVGLAVDIFRAAAERAGYTVEFIPVPLRWNRPSPTDGRWR
jgi:hypothetical protein